MFLSPDAELGLAVFFMAILDALFGWIWFLF